MNVRIAPFSAKGSLSVPSSKSELHRLLIAAALADGETEIRCRAVSADVLATVRCLRALGAGIDQGPDGMRVRPVKGECRKKTPVLDCGESGSTLRFLLPLAAVLGGADFQGRGRLPERPLTDLASAMEAHGARFSASRLPLTVRGPMVGGFFSMPGNVSSQYITGLMLAAPLLGETEIRIPGELQSADYVRMTADSMAVFGVMTEFDGNRICIPGGQRYHSPGSAAAGGDWSGAAFPLCLGALGGPVHVTNLDVSSAQGDKRILDILRQAGAVVDEKSGGCSQGTLHGLRLDVSGIPDMVPALAALLMHADGQTVFERAGRLRLKESDRLATTCAMVNALGGCAYVEDESLVIEGRSGCTGGRVDGAGDHRIVMAALVGASACTGTSEIMGAEAVAKSWPGFFEDIGTLGGRTDVVDIW